jgi:hypothetical protein
MSSVRASGGLDLTEAGDLDRPRALLLVKVARPVDGAYALRMVV